jgi:hypothetical protein
LAVSALVVAVVGVGVAALREGPPRLPPFHPSAPAPAPAPILATAPEGRVRVEVLNAGGVSGMAREVTGILREVGFDVVDFGNASSFDLERPSAVIDRIGRPDLAQAVANVLGIDNVLSEPNPNLYVDVSVLLGSEWTRPHPVRDEERRGGRAWWDPRAWLSR